MAATSSWIHGNALTIESPLYVLDGREIGKLALTPLGWGAWVSVEGSARGSWMHLPIPTVNSSAGFFNTFELRRLFLLFYCTDAYVGDVHIYDGSTKVQEFGRALEGNYLAKGTSNTFELTKPHRVRSGVGLSFMFIPKVLTGGGAGGRATDPSLVIAAAGAEFDTGGGVLKAAFSTLSSTIGWLFP